MTLVSFVHRTVSSSRLVSKEHAMKSLRLPAPRSLRGKVKMPLACLTSVVVVVAVFKAPVDAALIDGLVAYYDFNQSSGTSLPLVAGTGNDGVLNNMNNADWVAGQSNFGNALDFDGSNDFVHIADGYTNTVSGDNTHTVSMWVYPRSVSIQPLLLDAEDGGGFDYFIELGNATVGYAGVGGVYRNYTDSALSLTVWHHIAFTKTGAGDSGALYLDGVLLTTFTGTLASTPSLTSDFLLAKYRGTFAYNFDGRIDDLAFWDRDLSEAEVGALFSLGSELGQEFPVPVVPEPSTLALLGLGMVGVAMKLRRRRTAA